MMPVNGRRRTGPALVAALLLVLLTGCGGSRTSDPPGRLDMVISVTPDGDADVRIQSADPNRSDAELQDVSGQLVQAVVRRSAAGSVPAGGASNLYQPRGGGGVPPWSPPSGR